MNTLPEKVVSIYPPTVINTVDGTRFAVYSGSGWFQVDEDFTLEDAMSHWEKWTPNGKTIITEEVKDKSWQVESSKKGSFYTVRNNGHYWGCSCPANTYHRNKECRHIREIKEKTGWKP